MQYIATGGANARRHGVALSIICAAQLALATAAAQQPADVQVPVIQATPVQAPVATPEEGSNATLDPTQARFDEVLLQQPAASALHGDGRASSATPLPDVLRLFAGQAAVHRVPGALRRVAVGNGEVLSVHTVGRNEVVLIGTRGGETTLHLWLSDGTQRSIPVSVSADSSDAVAATVRTLLGNVPGLTVMPVGANVVVSGNELDEGTGQRLAAIQKLYPQVLNFASVDPVGMRPMVKMDVQIMEFNRNALEELGIRWDTAIAGPLGGVIKDVTTNPFFRVLPGSNRTFDDLRDTLPPRLPGTQAYFGIASTIASSINLLMSQGKAWVLASPQLSVRSGSEATFLAGGEVPIVVPSLLGTTQIEYKEYGVRLNIQPSVNDQGQVFTSVMAEVSRIDPSVSVQGVPGFLTRRTQSEINVHTGETIVISGLIDTSAATSADKFPLLGDIPVLGRLFRSDGFRGQRTELVVFVTPRVVSPASPENQESLRHGQRIRDSVDDEISRRQKKMIGTGG
ncbi:type II and III secretion system protein family protein [Lysobacter korlensis]|uniref:Type II and III secretion system protein family protein n=1 Tax=Lysobacter korlensis TaxID=553636 RepID=A0ABV6RHV0_9GAMM